MGLLDPTVCDEAKLLIEQGRIGDAARLLLKTPEPRHKSVQRGLADVAARRNARAAREANEQHWELARVSIELAAQCAERPDDGRVLRVRIAQEHRRLQAQRNSAWFKLGSQQA